MPAMLMPSQYIKRSKDTISGLWGYAGRCVCNLVKKSEDGSSGDAVQVLHADLSF